MLSKSAEKLGITAEQADADYLNGDFITIRNRVNPFVNPTFIDAMLVELLCRINPIAPADQSVDDADHRNLWGYYLEAMDEALARREWGQPASEPLVKLLAIGTLLDGRFTDKEWARVFKLYDIGWSQRCHLDDDEDGEVAA